MTETVPAPLDAVVAEVTDQDGNDPGGVGNGGYEFNGDALCVHADTDDPGSVLNPTPGGTVGTVPVGGNRHQVSDPSAPVTIRSSGTYLNTVCGTGTATGDPVTTAASGTEVDSGPGLIGDAWDFPVFDVAYDIAFVAGVGALEIHSATNIDGSVGGGHGVIDIVPTEGSCVSGEGVTEFLVNGAFVVTLNQP